MEIVSTKYTTIGGCVQEHFRLFKSVYVVVRIFGKTPVVTVSEFRNGGAAVKNRVRKFISVLAPANVRTTITLGNVIFENKPPEKSDTTLCLERFDLGGIRILNKVPTAVMICVVLSGF